MANKLTLIVALIATLLCRPCTASNNSPRLIKILNITGADRPESVAFGGRHTEGPYTGVSDGRILKWCNETHNWTDFAFHNSPRDQCVIPVNPAVEDICGRPLGLRFHHKTGDLYYADAYFGLSVVGPEGGFTTQLVTEAEGQPIMFGNDLDIDHYNNLIYFSDSSANFQRRNSSALTATWDRTGRLIEYNILTKQVRVLVRNISFANGVSLSKNGRFVLVAESRSSRILRYWLKGSKAGEVDVFAELPGDPDNIRRNSDGDFWVAVYVGPTVQTFAPVVVKLSEDGKVLASYNLTDNEGKTFSTVSEVEEKDGKLWMGSITSAYISVFNL